MNPLFVDKYKPNYFKDYDKDINVIPTIKQLIDTNFTNILLNGDNNSGKSTIINTIFNEYFRGIPHSKFNHNVLYINNISDQGINYYRNDVKNFCQICSNIPNKKKMIIMDDIDLINDQSQQVFRSFIDKYSHNVLFIASTSNIQKVLDSLQSRFTILKLHPFQKSTIMNLINTIKTNEKITIHSDAEEFIIQISNNNIKLLIQYLQKCKLLQQPITLDLASKVCCDISFFIFEKYTQYVLDQSLVKAINILLELYDKGYSIIDILDGYFVFVKKTTLIKENKKYEIIKYICKYISIFNNVHEDEIELTLFTNNLVELMK